MSPIYLLAVLTLLGHVVQTGGRLAVMLYALHLDASPAVVGVITALFTLVGLFTSVSVGRWIDRSGARIPMLIGSGMIVVGASIGFFWRELAALFVMAVLIGGFYNLIFIAQQRLGGQYGRPEDRVRNFSLISMFQSIGGMIGPLIAGIAIDSLGHPAAFLMFTLIAAVPFAVLAMGLLVYPPHEPQVQPRAGERRAGILVLFRDDELRRIYAISVLTSSTWSVLMFLLPLYGTQIGLGASTIGFIIGSFSLATVAIRMVLPWMSRHYTHWQLMIASLAATGAGFVAVPEFTNVAILTFVAAWIGIALGLCGPMSQAILYDASPAGRVGELLGLRVMMLNGSHAVVPVMTGVLGTAVGVAPVFWAFAACLFAGSWMIRAQWRVAENRGQD